MTKAEQERLVAWRLRILQHAANEPRHVAQDVPVLRDLSYSVLPLEEAL